MHFPLVYVVFETDCYSGSKGPCNHTNVVYNSYLYISIVVAICSDFDSQPYTVEIGVALCVVCLLGHLCMYWCICVHVSVYMGVATILGGF